MLTILLKDTQYNATTTMDQTGLFMNKIHPDLSQEKCGDHFYPIWTKSENAKE